MHTHAHLLPNTATQKAFLTDEESLVLVVGFRHGLAGCGFDTLVKPRAVLSFQNLVVDGYDAKYRVCLGVCVLAWWVGGWLFCLERV